MPKLVKSENMVMECIAEKKPGVRNKNLDLKFEVDKQQIIDLRKDKAFCVHLYKTQKKRKFIHQM